MSRSLFNGNADDRSDTVTWELRPGGMFVQKREDASNAVASGSGSLIRIKVSHRGSYQHEISVPAQATFWDVKKALAQETSLEPQVQRLLFRGKEKENDEHLHMAGVHDLAKLVLLEDPASKERKIEEMNTNQNITKACQAIAEVRGEVNKLSEKVSAIETAVNAGTKVDEKSFLVLTEMLMVQLLKLDTIEAEGDARVQRKMEVRRIQKYVETLDSLKAHNSMSFVSSNSVNVTTKWETFDSGMGSLNAPHASKVTKDWELFD